MGNVSLVPKGKPAVSYFMQDTVTGCVKIGHSTRDPVLRLKAQQTGNASPLELLGFVQSDVKHGLTERQLHRRFKRWSVGSHSREWFTPEVLPEVNKILREWGISSWGSLQGETA